MAPNTSQAGPATAPPPKAPIANPTLNLGPSTFEPAAQRFIIQAMYFRQYTAEQIAPCFGMREDGTLKTRPEDITVARDFLVNNRNNLGLLPDWRMWEQLNAYEERIKNRIQQAASEQARRVTAVRENRFSQEFAWR
ncbi:MAG: hypothetical protein Q9195_004096 [Heterodermia aff. obscurata]